MSSRPEPGDSEYYAVQVSVQPEQSPIGLASGAEEDPFEDDTLEYETVEVGLVVEVVDVDGDQATIDMFNEQRMVPVTQLHPTPPATGRVYSAGPGSPYTSLEDIQNELRTNADETEDENS